MRRLTAAATALLAAAALFTVPATAAAAEKPAPTAETCLFYGPDVILYGVSLNYRACTADTGLVRVTGSMNSAIVDGRCTRLTLRIGTRIFVLDVCDGQHLTFDTGYVPGPFLGHTLSYTF
ncbi:hypothetical protein SRB5_45280 [Streptomyces sp. RB5]|uniref:Uncharacterized protein n=1 Tax=Streptomyces smaragdinus TaxID=2585196 RepID=A0A7K0CMV2_9ACTN|nr:hypothetical protein [Streptomyces smaragdinus]MQY14362.1 hypothetical protein [Streptomyces smaragdinus]